MIVDIRLCGRPVRATAYQESTQLRVDRGFRVISGAFNLRTLEFEGRLNSNPPLAPGRQE